jgi:hypothetical protein
MAHGKSTERSGMSQRNKPLAVIARVGIVLCLLLAALSLAVGVSEYPGYTPAALHYMTSEVLPLVFVGWVNLAALDAPPSRARLVGLVALEIDLALLVHALPTVTATAAPFALMQAGAAGMLVLAALGLAVATVFRGGSLRGDSAAQRSRDQDAGRAPDRADVFRKRRGRDFH